MWYEKMEGLREILKEKNPEIMLEQVTDKDGNMFNIDKFEVGGIVSLVSTDGTMIPCKKGEYVFTNGNHVMVGADDGVITQIMNDAPADGTDVPAETTQPIQNSAEDNKVTGQSIPVTNPEDVKPFPDERLVAVEDAVNMINSKLEELMTLMESLSNETVSLRDAKKSSEKDKKELSKQIEQLKKTPAAEPINLSALTQSNSDDEKYRKIQELTEEMRKINGNKNPGRINLNSNIKLG